MNEFAYRGQTPFPGIPVYGPMSHLNGSNPYNAAVQSPANLYPKGEDENQPYPLLRRYFDCIENDASTEFDVGGMVQTSVVSAFFKSLPITTGIVSLNTKETNLIQLNAFPNPVVETTTISFFIPQACKASVSIRDIHGKKVLDVVDENLLNGKHSTTINLSGLAPGIYFCQLQTPLGNATNKMVVIK